MIEITPIKNELDIFEEKLKNIMEAENNFLKNDLESFMFKSPKRLRPILVFLFSKILKIENDIVYDIALALELIHSATLVHDDILDEDELRRNNPTLYKKYGSKIAVLEGDFLLTLALEALSKTNMDILKVFSDKIKKTLLGELNQNETLNKIPDEKYYLNKTILKTANLFLAGLEALFTIKKIDGNLKKALLDFTLNFSIAFQIKNDTKDIISDIKNGNYTLVVLYFLMENSIEELNINSNFDKYIKKALLKVDYYKKLSLKSLDTIENSTYKNAIVDLSNSIL